MTIHDGDWTMLFDSWLAIGLWTFAVVGFILPLIAGRYFRPKLADSDKVEGADPD
jgi:putative tricarboxylic transport membrane protein